MSVSRALEEVGGSEPYFGMRRYETVQHGYQSWEALVDSNNAKTTRRRRSLSHNDIIPWLHEVFTCILV